MALHNCEQDVYAQGSVDDHVAWLWRYDQYHLNDEEKPYPLVNVVNVCQCIIICVCMYVRCIRRVYCWYVLTGFQRILGIRICYSSCRTCCDCTLFAWCGAGWPPASCIYQVIRIKSRTNSL